MHLKKHICIAFFFLFGASCFAQGGFKKKYFLQDNINCISLDVVETPSSNLIVFGLSGKIVNNLPYGSLNLIGLNAQGHLLWQKKYGNPVFQYRESFQVRGAVVSTSNAIYHAAVVKESNNVFLGVLMKFNFSGDTIWQKRFYSGLANVNLIFNDVVKAVDGGFLMTGTIDDNTIPQQSILILKTDINGNELWRKKIVNPTPATTAWCGIKVIQDSLTKKILLVGYQINTNTTKSLIMATDSLGTELWHTTFNNAGGGGFGEIIQTKDKKFITCGGINMNSDLGNFTRYKSLVVKFDINGNSIWSKTYDITSPYTGIGVLNELTNGDLIMGGNLDTMLNHNLPQIIKLRIIKTDKDGNVKWKKYIGSSYDEFSGEYMRGMNPTQDGGFVLAAWPYFAPNPQPFSIVKIDSTGCDTLEAYCQSITTGITKLEDINGWQLNIFPNPANETLNIKLNAPEDRTTVLQITDVSGRVVMETSLRSNENTDINTGDLSPGVYFVSLMYQSRSVETRKLVIAR